MAYQLNAKIRNMEPYTPVIGEYQVRLDANESFMDLPDSLKQKIAEGISRIPFHRYPDPYASGVCGAFAGYYGVDPANVTAGNGSDELIGLIFASFFQKGDKVMLVAPDFSMYQFYADIYELETCVIKKKPECIFSNGMDGRFLTKDVLSAAKENGVAGIIFSNPCNPTSQGLSHEDILAIAREFEGLFILDEAYMDFWDQSVITTAAEFDNLLVLRTCSKMMGLAAIRLGFAVANPAITKALHAVKSPYNVNSVTQMIGEIVLSDWEYLDSCQDRLEMAREQLYRGVCALREKYPVFELAGSPKTNFMFLRLANASDVHKALLECSISVRLMGDRLRITAGSEEENARVLRELENIFKA